MRGTTIKRFNWVRSPTAWEQTSAWRARQQAASDNFEAAHAAASNAFATASLNLVNGMGGIATQTAVNRIQSQQISRVLDTLA